MDEQTIIRIAQEAGIYYRDDYEFCEIDRDGVPMEMMARFAALVAAGEREACAKVCEEGMFLEGFGAKTEEPMDKRIGKAIANAIRARSNI